MRIIVIGQTSYQEKDLIINAISSDGPISFKVRGGLSPTSPFGWLNTPLVVADVEYVENVRYRHQILKGATMVSSPMEGEVSLEKMESLSLVLEVINKMFSEDEKHLMYYETERFIAAVKSASKFHLMELIYIAKAIYFAGSALEVNRCVFCGSKKNIVAFSFSDGGFVCKKCIQDNTNTELSYSQMKLIRYVVNKKNYEDLPEDKVSIEDMRALFIKFRDFISEGIGANLDIIDKIVKEL